MWRNNDDSQAITVRDRLLLELDMTNALRPSELFGLRWKGFNPAASTMSVTETVYKGKIRPWGKTRRSLATIPIPKALSEDLVEWKRLAGDPSPDAFIFPSKDGGPLDTDNYRKRVLYKLARNLELPKLTFQVIRRTIATLAQKKGTVKDVQGLLRHSRAATTTDVYMQEIPASVQATINSIHRELKAKAGSSDRAGKKSLPGSDRRAAVKPKRVGIGAKRAIPSGPNNGSKLEQPAEAKDLANLLPNATNSERGDSVSY
jgi:integrase